MTLFGVFDGAGVNSRPVRLAYQPPASSTFLSEQTSHQQPTSNAFLSEQISINHQHQPNEQAVSLQFGKTETKSQSEKIRVKSPFAAKVGVETPMPQNVIIGLYCPLFSAMIFFPSSKENNER
jgi:hypothetical protein